MYLGERGREREGERESNEHMGRQNSFPGPDVDLLPAHLLVEVEETEHDVHVEVPVLISLLHRPEVQQAPEKFYH